MAKVGKDPGSKPQRGNSFYFWIGVVLVGVSLLVLLQSARVVTSWHIWRIGSLGLPTGTTVIPLLIGIGMLFYNPKMLAAKIVTAIGAGFILVTLMLSVRLTFTNISLFNYVLMFGTLAGGLGFILRGLFARPKG